MPPAAYSAFMAKPILDPVNPGFEIVYCLGSLTLTAPFPVLRESSSLALCLAELGQAHELSTLCHSDTF